MSLPLAAPALLASLPSLVESSSTPTLASPLEALTLLLHATHVALGFRLAPASTTGDGGKLAAEALKRGEIEYKHAQSSLTFVVRVGKLGGRAVVDAMAVEVRDLPRVVSASVARSLTVPSRFAGRQAAPPLLPARVQARTRVFLPLPARLVLDRKAARPRLPL
jgi:hypothetical protein